LKLLYPRAENQDHEHQPNRNGNVSLLRGLYVCHAQETADDPDVLLRKALHLGDLYNWADGASFFTEAERLYAARGDNRNALYAHLGRIRSTMEQLSLPEVSEELGVELDKNPLLQSDKELRLFCLMVLGDIDGEMMPHQCAAIGSCA